MDIIERAFQLAAESGTLEERKRKLRREGYFQVEAHLVGRQIRAEIGRRLSPDLIP